MLSVPHNIMIDSSAYFILSTVRAIVFCIYNVKLSLVLVLKPAMIRFAA